MKFEEWWYNIGSGIGVKPGDDYEEHAKRVAQAAWESAQMSASAPAPTRDRAAMNGTLHLVLTYHWFDEIEAGRKHIEYRHRSARWHRLIMDASPHTVIFHRGYTARTLTATVVRIDIGPCPYEGWGGDYYRIHFMLRR